MAYLPVKKEKTIKVDFDDIHSVKKAERTREGLLNRNYVLTGTHQEGFSKYNLIYEKR
jgi:hypothetical protein